jgi:hypothetical protein
MGSVGHKCRPSPECAPLTNSRFSLARIFRGLDQAPSSAGRLEPAKTRGALRVLWRFPQMGENSPVVRARGRWGQPARAARRGDHPGRGLSQDVGLVATEVVGARACGASVASVAGERRAARSRQDRRRRAITAMIRSRSSAESRGHAWSTRPRSGSRVDGAAFGAAPATSRAISRGS